MERSRSFQASAVRAPAKILTGLLVAVMVAAGAALVLGGGELIAAGAAGVAVMGGVMRAADPAREVAALIATLEGARAIRA